MTDNSTQLSRKEREEAFRRELVLDVAESLFAEKGFDGTTVSDIAERSELAKGSLYQIFQSKEEIIAAIIGRKIDRIWGIVDDIVKRPISPTERVREVFRTKLESVWESRHFARIFLHELRGLHPCVDSPLLDAYVERMRAMTAKIEVVFAEGQEKGDFRRDVPASTLFAAMEGFSNAIIYTWLNCEGDFDLDTAVRQAEDLFLHGVGVSK